MQRRHIMASLLLQLIFRHGIRGNALNLTVSILIYKAVASVSSVTSVPQNHKSGRAGLSLSLSSQSSRGPGLSFITNLTERIIVKS